MSGQDDRAQDWATAASRFARPSVEAVLVVQCGLDWLRPHQLALRNAIDEALIEARCSSDAPHITRVLLHNLPACALEGPEGVAMAHSFTEWNHRLAASAALLSGPSPHVQRLIIGGAESGASVPDMVSVLEHGHWSDAELREQVLRIVERPGATTPLTVYDVDLDGPYSDVDPSVHM
ncbi:hypothetical protein [Streptomyces alfalfae]|uniref:Uncharacterized protein n=1 Tax=Streptomyces alfalfae TaxID=1642299 RepID=A0A7T4PG80_9ACTN|nr:hypothetical protein [Streptomyces alfalfae]QQC89484.1 hypothetical protein I8755_14450 [Streptomyces alfalfae]